MLRRVLIFILFVTVVTAVSGLVYMNAEEQSFRFTKDYELTLPFGVLMLMSAIAGMLFMFVLALLREGRSAIREWRIHRGIRTAERTAELRGEARSLSLAGDYEKARTLFTRATKRRDPDVSDLIDFAGTYVLEGEYAEARRLLESGQQDFGNNPLLLYALAKTCIRIGDEAAAASALERALAVYPKSLRLLTTLRDVLMDTEQWQRASEIQQRVLELKPEDEIEKNWLTGMRFEAAVRLDGPEHGLALKNLCAQAPDFVPALLERAKDLAARDDKKRALRLLDKAVRNTPNAALLDELEALSGDDPGRLTKLYAKLVASHPDNTGLRTRAAKHLVANDNAEEAADLLSSDESGCESAATHELWAEIHESRSDTAKAAVEYRNAARIRDDGPSLYVCGICSSTAIHWDPRCGHCSAWGSLDAAAT
jgi:tetratricopeptide (TPR) repeat protein